MVHTAEKRGFRNIFFYKSSLKGPVQGFLLSSLGKGSRIKNIEMFCSKTRDLIWINYRVLCSFRIDDCNIQFNFYPIASLSLPPYLCIVLQCAVELIIMKYRNVSCPAFYITHPI